MLWLNIFSLFISLPVVHIFTVVSEFVFVLCQVHVSVPELSYSLFYFVHCHLSSQASVVCSHRLLYLFPQFDSVHPSSFCLSAFCFLVPGQPFSYFVPIKAIFFVMHLGPNPARHT